MSLKKVQLDYKKCIAVSVAARKQIHNGVNPIKSFESKNETFRDCITFNKLQEGQLKTDL